jgi:hypothetical protein
MAWTLSRLLNVPLDFAFKDIVVRADSVDQITTLVKEKEYRQDEKRLHSLQTSLIFRIICSLVVCVVLMGVYNMIDSSLPKSYEIPSIIVILAGTFILIGISVSSYYKSKLR